MENLLVNNKIMVETKPILFEAKISKKSANKIDETLKLVKPKIYNFAAWKKFI